MRVKAIVDCVGIGYDLKRGEEAELKTELAELLIRFDHVKEVKPKKVTK